MGNITLLDCTLRDGGHITQGFFGENTIRNVIQNLVDSKIDIIEVGFLMEEKYSNDYARYRCISDMKRILPINTGKSKITLMADFVNLENIEECDGTVEFIRLSFKRFRLEWALKTAEIIKEKGYKCFINPVNINVYSDLELLELIDKVNTINPFGFSIVDTFGVLRNRDLLRIHQLVDNNLNSDVVLGLHLHENLGLSLSLAQSFLENKNPKRNINIDCSLLGMGREPGNLHTEQIMSHMNNEYGTEYDLEPVFDAIDDYVMPIYNNNPWGYRIPYALSAEYKLHRTYGEYLMGKWKIKTHDINRILSMVDDRKAELFDEEYIENLYREYLSIPYDDEADISVIKEKLSSYKTILIIAPGYSIVEHEKDVSEFINRNSPFVFSVNFIPDQYVIDSCFFTNIKRYESSETQNISSLIITSNLIQYIKTHCKVIEYKKLSYHDGEFNDDSVLMLLNLLARVGIKNVNIAGFDGFIEANQNFYKEDFDRHIYDRNKTPSVKRILEGKYSSLSINYITPSIYSR